MKKQDIFNLFQIEDLQDLSGSISKLITSSTEQRIQVYSELLELNNKDLSHDWFQSVFEEELAQRSQSKQDFTPNSVGVLLSRLTGVEKGRIYEPTAGNGSLLIANWWHRKNNSEEYKYNDHPIDCWELSDRSIPFLLLNLSIRGVIGTVNHGDVLTKELKCQYILTRSDDSRFSEITQIKL